MPYTDRMDYMSPYSNNVAWCLAVEKLAGIPVPERAQWIRTMMSELARISAHLLWIGAMVMDAGALSVFLWTFKYREEIYSIFDEVAGARFTVSHSRIGGVATRREPRWRSSCSASSATTSTRASRAGRSCSTATASGSTATRASES